MPSTTAPLSGPLCEDRAPAARLPLVALLCLGIAACSAGPDAKTAPKEAEPARAVAAADAPAADASGEESSTEATERQETGDLEQRPESLPRSRSMAEALEEVYVEALRDVAEGSATEETGSVRIEYPEPPDGVWLQDDEGREYFVDEIAKAGRRYRMLDGDRVRMQYGMIYDLAGETDEALLVKIYKAEPLEAEPDDEPTPAETAALEADYSADLPAGAGLSFTDFGAGLPQNGQWRNGFDIGDMNGDGHPDLLLGPPRRSFSGPAILLGDGAGNWKHWEEVSWPEHPYDYGDAEAADFDGDGVMDVAFGVHLSGITAMVGDGDGTFTSWADGLDLRLPGNTTNETFLSRALASADWNGDGLPELVALSEGPRHPKATQRRAVETPLGLVVYPNHGDGTWGEGMGVPTELELFGDSLTTGDFDADGRPDVFSGSNALGLRTILFLNRGGAGLAGVEVEALRPLSFVWSVAAADFDGDGRDDVVMSTSGWRAKEWWGSLDVLLSREGEGGEPVFERLPLVAGREIPEKRVSAVGTGDVDGDGDADVVALTEMGEVWVFTGDGKGGFAAEDVAPSEPLEGCRGYHVQLEDLDGRPGDEVVAGFAGERCPQGGRLQSWKFSAR